MKYEEWPKAKTGQIPSVQRNSKITRIKSKILAKSQNEHKLEKGLALIPNELNIYSLIQIILLENLVNEISHKAYIYK